MEFTRYRVRDGSGSLLRSLGSKSYSEQPDGADEILQQRKNGRAPARPKN